MGHVSLECSVIWRWVSSPVTLSIRFKVIAVCSTGLRFFVFVFGCGILSEKNISYVQGFGSAKRSTDLVMELLVALSFLFFLFSLDGFAWGFAGCMMYVTRIRRYL